VSEARLYDNTRLSALSEPMEEIRKSITANEVLVAKWAVGLWARSEACAETTNATSSGSW
jgi:hypothetical protein